MSWRSARRILEAFCVAALGLSGTEALAQDVASFYSGNTVKIVVGGSPGATPDTFSRMIAPYLSKNLPGNPNVIVENKPGAGSVLASNLVYRVEPRDGTVANLFIEANLMLQGLGLGKNFEFDAAKFNWLGSGLTNTVACAWRRDKGVNDLNALLASADPGVIGSIGAGSSGHTVTKFMVDVLGGHMRIVEGYTGNARLVLAAESGEIDGYCAPFTSFLSGGRYLIEGESSILRLIGLFGAGRPAHPLAEGLPMIQDAAVTDEQKQIAELLGKSLALSASIWVSPEVPEERVLALRDAFAAALANPELIAEAARHDLIITPSSAENTSRIAHDLLNPPDAVKPQLTPLFE